jgi:hypothetical protein
MQYVPRMPHPSRTLAVPLAAAVLGAGVATATFALINIEDKPVPFETPSAVISEPASTTQRPDGGPIEGAAQRGMAPMSVPAGVDTLRYDGGPEEGTRGPLAQPPSSSSSGGNSFGARP